MTKFMSAVEFANKIEWEGGVVGALDYGLRASDLDPDEPDSAELRQTWAELEDKYSDVAVLVDDLDRILYEVCAKAQEKTDE